MSALSLALERYNLDLCRLILPYLPKDSQTLFNKAILKDNLDLVRFIFECEKAHSKEQPGTFISNLLQKKEYHESVYFNLMSAKRLDLMQELFAYQGMSQSTLQAAIAQASTSPKRPAILKWLLQIQRAGK